MRPYSPSFGAAPRMIRWRLSALIWSAAFAWYLMPAAWAQAPPVLNTDVAARELTMLQRRTAALERQLELARGKDFYLVLDPSGPDLSLMLRGAGLQRYAVLGVQVGRPRVWWVRRGRGVEWQGPIWSGGELDPQRPLDRLVVETDEPGREGEEAKPPTIPPTAEELYPVPSRYQIRFSGGLSIEVRPREADQSTSRLSRFRAWWTARWHDTWAALFASERDAVRLRVVLKPEDAASLYRALPPSTHLLVLPGKGAEASATDLRGR